MKPIPTEKLPAPRLRLVVDHEVAGPERRRLVEKAEIDG